jgi:2-polyprenyl-3-methyl-5-hydroxy-6-metoxy-1,4-benzoquinol methylase/ribosomal protein S27E
MLPSPAREEVKPEATSSNWEEVRCNLCGSERRVNFIQVARSFRANRPMILVKCLGCGLIYLNPRPGQEAIGQFYEIGYYAHSNMATRRRTLRAKLKDRFSQGLGGYGSSPDLWMLQRLGLTGWVDVIIPSTLRGKLLDVGCGDGERACWYQKRGFEAYGIETSEKAVTNARKLGLRVHHGTLSSAAYPDCHFDVVVMSHVLEHTHSPKAYLAECFRILKPGGTLAVAVPNIESHSARVFYSHWSFLMLPIHLYHFSVETLRAYLNKSGFAITSLVGKPVYPRMVRSSYRSIKQNETFRKSLSAWFRSGVIASGLATLKSGTEACDTITAYCVKPSDTHANE